jgi:hypothetical protein
MKRILIEMAAALLLIAGAGAGRAEGAGIEVGIKMWVNDWTQDVPGFGSITSDSTVLLGPAIAAKFGDRVFGEASFLFSTADYTFNATATNIERRDVDLAIGYMVVPGFGLSAGYKNSSFKEKETGFKSTVYGPVLGIIGIAPVAPDFSFYGKFNFLLTKFDGEFIREDSPGWIFEFGLTFAFTREFLGTLGYKYEMNEGNNTNIRDTFSGLTLSAMVAF